MLFYTPLLFQTFNKSLLEFCVIIRNIEFKYVENVHTVVYKIEIYLDFILWLECTIM